MNVEQNELSEFLAVFPTTGFTVTYPNGVSLTSDPVSATWPDPGT